MSKFNTRSSFFKRTTYQLDIITKPSKKEKKEKNKKKNNKK